MMDEKDEEQHNDEPSVVVQGEVVPTDDVSGDTTDESSDDVAGFFHEAMWVEGETMEALCTKIKDEASSFDMHFISYVNKESECLLRKDGKSMVMQSLKTLRFRCKSVKLNRERKRRQGKKIVVPGNEKPVHGASDEVVCPAGFTIKLGMVNNRPTAIAGRGAYDIQGKRAIFNIAHTHPLRMEMTPISRVTQLQSTCPGAFELLMEYIRTARELSTSLDTGAIRRVLQSQFKVDVYAKLVHNLARNRELKPGAIAISNAQLRKTVETCQNVDDHVLTRLFTTDDDDSVVNASITTLEMLLLFSLYGQVVKVNATRKATDTLSSSICFSVVTPFGAHVDALLAVVDCECGERYAQLRQFLNDSLDKLIDTRLPKCDDDCARATIMKCLRDSPIFDATKRFRVLMTDPVSSLVAAPYSERTRLCRQCVNTEITLNFADACQNDATDYVSRMLRAVSEDGNYDKYKTALTQLIEDVQSHSNSTQLQEFIETYVPMERADMVAEYAMRTTPMLLGERTLGGDLDLKETTNASRMMNEYIAASTEQWKAFENAVSELEMTGAPVSKHAFVNALVENMRKDIVTSQIVVDYLDTEYAQIVEREHVVEYIIANDDGTNAGDTSVKTFKVRHTSNSNIECVNTVKVAQVFESTTGKYATCDCQSYTEYGMPCRHVMKTLMDSNDGNMVYVKELFHWRWHVDVAQAIVSVLKAGSENPTRTVKESEIEVAAKEIANVFKLCCQTFTNSPDEFHNYAQRILDTMKTSAQSSSRKRPASEFDTPSTVKRKVTNSTSSRKRRAPVSSDNNKSNKKKR